MLVSDVLASMGDCEVMASVGDVPLLYSLLLEVGYVAFRTIGIGSLS